jgi:hypothetical protein
LKEKHGGEDVINVLLYLKKYLGAVDALNVLLQQANYDVMYLKGESALANGINV